MRLMRSASLHLDVWVPYNATTKSALPVKVWIYGGGEDAGGISNPLYNGCNLAKDDTVMVSINYRLGPLGFLALESAGIGGNFGIEDILLGLQWIQTNIAAFGGDPVSYCLLRNGTVLTLARTEKSALVRSIGRRYQHLHVSTLPQAKSLISVAISESGGGRDLATSAEMQPIGASFASSLGCSSKDVRNYH
jgi:carboxylesterase type B